MALASLTLHELLKDALDLGLHATLHELVKDALDLDPHATFHELLKDARRLDHRATLHGLDELPDDPLHEPLAASLQAEPDDHPCCFLLHISKQVSARPGNVGCSNAMRLLPPTAARWWRSNDFSHSFCLVPVQRALAQLALIFPFSPDRLRGGPAPQGPQVPGFREVLQGSGGSEVRFSSFPRMFCRVSAKAPGKDFCRDVRGFCRVPQRFRRVLRGLWGGLGRLWVKVSQGSARVEKERRTVGISRAYFQFVVTSPRQRLPQMVGFLVAPVRNMR